MKGEMLAAVWEGGLEITLKTKPVPELLDPRDAIVRVTLASKIGRAHV